MKKEEECVGGILRGHVYLLDLVAGILEENSWPHISPPNCISSFSAADTLH